MPHFLLRLVPPRASFLVDMTEAERVLMGQHAAYLAGEMAKGRVLAFGPVADPKGPFGFAIAAADTTAEVEAMTIADPVIKAGAGFSYEIAPILQLILPPAVQTPATH